MLLPFINGYITFTAFINTLQSLVTSNKRSDTDLDAKQDHEIELMAAQISLSEGRDDITDLHLTLNEIQPKHNDAFLDPFNHIIGCVK